MDLVEEVTVKIQGTISSTRDTSPPVIQEERDLPRRKQQQQRMKLHC